MICAGSEFNVPNYIDYRFQKFVKHKKKLNDQLSQIRQCSLNGGDKKKLINEMMDIMRDELQKHYR